MFDTVVKPPYLFYLLPKSGSSPTRRVPGEPLFSFSPSRREKILREPFGLGVVDKIAT